MISATVFSKVVEIAHERAALVACPVAGVVVEEGRRAVARVRRHAPRERQVVARLVVRAGLLEGPPAFAIDSHRGRVGPSRASGSARLESAAPRRRGAQPEPRRRRALFRRALADDELRVERAREVGPPERDRLLKDRVLLKDDAGRHQAAHGRRSGKRRGGSRYSRKDSMGGLLGFAGRVRGRDAAAS